MFCESEIFNEIDVNIFYLVELSKRRAWGMSSIFYLQFLN